MESLNRIRSSVKIPKPASRGCVQSDSDADECSRKTIRLVPGKLRLSFSFSAPLARSDVPYVCASIWRVGADRVIDRHARSNERGPRSFRFLDLPAELRTVLYEQMFVKTTSVQVCGYDFWSRPPIGDFHLWTHPLLRSNRQIRAEGLDVFFKHNDFSFDNEFNMNLFLNVIGDFGRERIRSVSLQRLPELWFGERGYGRHDWTRIENYMRMLARLPNLRSLTVERSPHYFQERVLGDDSDEEDTWYPDIHTMDVDDALRTAYLGWLPLHLRGLQQFSISWGPSMESELGAVQRRWFRDVERRIRAVVTRPKPYNYFQNRTKFIYKGYEAEDHITQMQYAKFYLERMVPCRLRYAVSRPSSFFSTYAYQPERYARKRMWHKRRKAVVHFLDDCWWDVRHPKSWWLRCKYRHSRVVYDDAATADFDFLAMSIMNMGPPPPPPPPLPVLPAVIMPPPAFPVSPQQAVVQVQSLDDGGPSTADSAVLGAQDLDGNDDDDDDEIPLASLTDSRASGSLPSLLRVLNID